MSVSWEKKAGTEGDLLQQSILSDLLVHLCPEDGNFWFLDGCVQAGKTRPHETARSLFVKMDEDPLSQEVEPLPLWHFQKETFEEGEFLSTSLLALHVLWKQCLHRVSLRMMFCHDAFAASNDFSEQLFHHTRQLSEDTQWSTHRHHFYQVVGRPTEIFQENVYLGVARAPGVAVLEPPDIHEECAPFLMLLETLLNRRFWVVLAFPTHDKSGKKRYISNAIRETLYQGVRKLEVNGVTFQLDSFLDVNGRNVTGELWVLTGEDEMTPWIDQSLGHLRQLLGGLGREVSVDGDVDGLRVNRLPRKTEGKVSSFFRQLPAEITTSVAVDLADEDDLEDVIRLWERLMDEHAAIDPHFQRRPLARLYLRRNLRTQIAQPDFILLVARWRHRVIAFLSAQILRAPLFQETRFGQIVDVYILPEWRKQKIGSTLVQQAYLWFRSLGLTHVDLNIAVENMRAEQFWKKQGFKPYLYVSSRNIEEE